MFIKEDLPTFDRPMNPNSGLDDAGQSFNTGLLLTNSAERMIMFPGYFRSL
jgi:hypothetical protein